MLRTRDAQNGSTIDRNGNRWTQYVNGNMSPGNLVPSTNQITSTSGVAYDAMGNVSQWNNSVTNHTYVYDAEGRIVSVDSGSVKYIYDAFGRRAEKIVNDIVKGAAWGAVSGAVAANVLTDPETLGLSAPAATFVGGFLGWIAGATGAPFFFGSRPRKK